MPESSKLSEESPRETFPSDKQKATMFTLEADDAYRLTELKVLEGIEAKFWVRARRIAFYVSIPLVLAAFLGIRNFNDWLKTMIDERVKIEVSKRVDSQLAKFDSEINRATETQRAKLDSQIEKNLEAGIMARAASTETKGTLNELKAEARRSETIITQLRHDATATLKDLEERFTSQRQELQRLNSFVKSYYENCRTDTFKLKQSNDLLSVVGSAPNRWWVFIRLPKIPIAQSVSLQYHIFAQPPDSFYVLKDNIVVFAWWSPIEQLEQQHLYVTYAVQPDAGNGFKSLTIKDNRLYGDDQMILILDSLGKQ